mgnify:CR=1 FL=1
MSLITISPDFNRYNTSLQAGILTSLFAFANQDFQITKKIGANDYRIIRAQYMAPEADNYVWFVQYGPGTLKSFSAGPLIEMFDNPSPNVLRMLADWLASEPGM